jgi:glutamate-1-semialdehyde aminotransferase
VAKEVVRKKLYGIKADIVCFGKVLVVVLPFRFCCKTAIMDYLAQGGPFINRRHCLEIHCNGCRGMKC